MNREHAEHILDAYLSTCYAVDADGMYPDTDSKKARDSLREVILDAMTEYRSKPTTWPGITVSPTSYPTNWDGTPKVTCTGLTVNGMEVFKVHHGPEVGVVDE